MSARGAAFPGLLCLVVAVVFCARSGFAATQDEAFAKVTVEVLGGIQVAGDPAPKITVGEMEQETWARAMTLSGWNGSRQARMLKTDAKGEGAVEYYGLVDAGQDRTQVRIYVVTWHD